MTDASPPPRRLWMIMLAMTVMGCVVIALLAEAGVRARHWFKHGNLWGVEDSFTLDPATGLRVPVKNSQLGPIVINSLGFRGPEIAVPKPPGTIRLAFLGGSATFCAEVSDNEHTWPDLVWLAIEARWPEAKIDYVNAGVPGYTLASLRKSLQTRIAPLAPDILVIYEAGNDLSGNAFDLARREGLVHERTEESLSWLSNYSLLWYLVEKNLLIMQRQMESESASGLLHADLTLLTAPFRADLEALVRESQQISSLVVLITFSQRLRHGQSADERREASITSRYYMPYMSSDQALAGFDAYNAVIREVAAQTGALLVGDEETIPADAAHFADSVHFTDLGSEAQAARVVQALLASDRVAALIAAKSSGGL